MEETCSHPEGLYGKQKNVEHGEADATQSVQSVLAHSDEDYPVSGLHVNFARKK